MASVEPEPSYGIEMNGMSNEGTTLKVKGNKTQPFDKNGKGLASKVWKSLASTVEKDKAMESAKDKGVPTSMMVTVWLVAKMVYVVVIIYLTWYTTTTDQAKKYLSPEFKFGGSKSYRLCLEIPNSFSGTWMFDNNGYWEGTKNFIRGYAKYSVEFSNFEHTYSEYTTFMQVFKDTITTLGTAAKTSAISQNLLKWTTFASSQVDGDNIHVLRPTADPATLFDKLFKVAGLIGNDAFCGVTPDITYNEGTGYVKVDYPLYNYGQVFDISTGRKGCCSKGTVYTEIGNPASKALEISSTWGVEWSDSTTQHSTISNLNFVADGTV